MDKAYETIEMLFLPERRLVFANTDNVLAKYDYDAHLQDIEFTVLGEMNNDNGYLRDRINDIYKDHVTKLLLMHGVDVYGYVTDLSLMTNMLDAIVLAQYQTDTDAVLNILVLDGEKSAVDVYAELVVTLTESNEADVLSAIKDFDDNLMVKLKLFLEETKPTRPELTADNVAILDRYKQYVGMRRTGLVYQYLSTGNPVGNYKAKELYLLLEDGFKLINDQPALQFEVLSLVLASDTPNNELLNMLRTFSRIMMETPALQLQMYNQMVKQLPPLDNLVLSEEMS